MKRSSLEWYRCPADHTPLRFVQTSDAGEVETGTVVSATGREYPITRGVPYLLYPETLSVVEEETQSEYDRVADGIYDVAVDWQFAAFMEDEHKVRETMVELLEVQPNYRVLEVGCGTGRDSFRLARRLDARGVLFMQDLSANMVHACVAKMSAYARETPFACGLEYSVSNATYLPFPDGFVDAVFHFGGFNQFGDLRRAAEELTRVTRVGGRVLIGDEAVAPWLKGTEFEGIVTTNNALFKADAPLSVLPESARDVTIKWLIGNCFYLFAYTKGDGPPPLDLDLPHKGWRGGTMRSRYFGHLEGVTPEAKALARDAAIASGMSVHEWLDALVKNAARTALKR